MIISYSLSEKEFVKASLRAVRESRWMLSINATLLVVMAGVGIFVIASGASSSGIVLLIFAFLLAAWRFVVVPRRLAAKTYRSAKFMHDSITAEISEEGTRMTYPSGSSDTKWSGYVSSQETDDMFVLFLSDRLMRMFPKRAFSGDDFEAMRELLQRKLPKKG